MADDLRSRFATLLRTRRLLAAAPLNTQEGLAEHLGVTQPAVSAWEKGRTLPSVPLLLTILPLLDIKAEELTGETVVAS